MHDTNSRGRRLRVLFATSLSLAALASLAVLGGVGFAKNSISAAQYQYGPKGKAQVCHKGKTINVSKASLKAHLKHGDTEGPCASDARKGKQKGKGKGKPESDSSAPASTETTTAPTATEDSTSSSTPSASDAGSTDKGHDKPDESGHSKPADKGHGKPDDKGHGKPDDKGPGKGKGK